MSRLARFLAVPHIALDLAIALWMVSNAPHPAPVTRANPGLAVQQGRLIAMGIDVLHVDPAECDLTTAQTGENLMAHVPEAMQIAAEWLALA